MVLKSVNQTFLNDLSPVCRYSTAKSLMKPCYSDCAEQTLKTLASKFKEIQFNSRLEPALCCSFINTRGEIIWYCHDAICILIQIWWYYYDTIHIIYTFFNIFRFLNSNHRIIEYIIQKQYISSSILWYHDMYLDDCIMINHDMWCIISHLINTWVNFAITKPADAMIPKNKAS